MKLSHVAYSVFEFEASEPWSEDAQGWHQIDGQVVLSFSDQECLFVSWQWGFQGVSYHIAQQRKSFSFGETPLVSLSMEDHPYWKGLIGQEIEPRILDPGHQVLMLDAGVDKIFLSSQYDDGVFEGDCVRISKVNPLG